MVSSIATARGWRYSGQARAHRWRTGTRRWLQHTGVLDDATICKSEGTRFLRVRDRNDFAVATIDGVFEPNVDLGDAVTCGDVAGWLHPVATTTAPALS